MSEARGKKVTNRSINTQKSTQRSKKNAECFKPSQRLIKKIKQKSTYHSKKTP